MEKMRELLQEADKIVKELNITRTEALQLISTYHSICIHDHIEKVIFGVFNAHAPEKPEEGKRR